MRPVKNKSHETLNEYIKIQTAAHINYSTITRHTFECDPRNRPKKKSELKENHKMQRSEQCVGVFGHLKRWSQKVNGSKSDLIAVRHNSIDVSKSIEI